jgi:hypothetical protein
MRRIVPVVVLVSALLSVTANASWATAQIGPTYSDQSMPSNHGTEAVGAEIYISNNPTPGPGQVSPQWFFAVANLDLGNGFGGYFGFQQGSFGKRTLFSLWGGTGGACVVAGCTSEAFVEDGTGWHIANPYQWQAGHYYYLYVHRSNATGSSWDFRVQDMSTGVWTFMGWLNTGTYVGSILNVNSHFTEWIGAPANCSQYPIWNVYALPIDTYSQHGYTPSGVKTTNTFTNLLQGGTCSNASVTRYGEWVHHALGS